MENYKFSEEYCQKIIDSFQNTDLLFHQKTHNRNYKKFKIDLKDEFYKWLIEDVDNLIKKNLGNSHYITLWLIILKYDTGDYFLPHTDGYGKTENRCLSGGVELSKREEFEGGDFVVNNIPRKFERGKLITHKIDEIHEITKVTKGTRWSLHFGINNRNVDLI